MVKDRDFSCRIMDRLGLPAEASRRGFLLSALGVPNDTPWQLKLVPLRLGTVTVADPV